MIQEMIERAFDTLKYSYSPYSHFKVAAALLTESGKIYTGCNIENAAYSPTNCAERTAVFKAVSEGEKRFQAICIVNEDEEGNHGYCPPCGVCRQVLMEFADAKKLQVILAKNGNEYKVYTLAELLPMGFGPESL